MFSFLHFSCAFFYFFFHDRPLSVPFPAIMIPVFLRLFSPKPPRRTLPPPSNRFRATPNFFTLFSSRLVFSFFSACFFSSLKVVSHSLFLSFPPSVLESKHQTQETSSLFVFRDFFFSPFDFSSFPTWAHKSPCCPPFRRPNDNTFRAFSSLDVPPRVGLDR